MWWCIKTETGEKTVPWVEWKEGHLLMAGERKMIGEGATGEGHRVGQG